MSLASDVEAALKSQVHHFARECALLSVEDPRPSDPGMCIS